MVASLVSTVTYAVLGKESGGKSTETVVGGLADVPTFVLDTVPPVVVS